MKLSKPKKQFKSPQLAALVVTSVAIGSVVVLTFAAGPGASFLLKNGTLSNGATVVANSGAIGGSMVRFGGSTPTPTATPAPTATATPTTGGCAWPAFPDAACTGPSGSLPLYTGTTDFRTAGAVIQNVEIRTDGIYVGADNITFINVKIVYTGALDANFTLFNIPPGVTGTVFEDCEIDGQSKVARAIKGISDVRVSRCEIHHTANAVEVGTSFTVEDSYLHDIVTTAGQDWHADGVQSAESVSNITVRHNTILLTGGETGAVNIIGNAGDAMSNILVEKNLMAGGSYTVYLGAPSSTNVRAIDNHFSTRYSPKVGAYNIWYPSYMDKYTRTGNVIHETGAAANN